MSEKMSTYKNTSRRSSKILVAIVGNVTSKQGFSLIQAAEKLDGKTIGRCIVVDADVDVLTILDWANEHGAQQVYLVFPPCKPQLQEKPGISYVEGHPETKPLREDPQILVKNIWMNLTGSLARKDVVSAMRTLSHLPFKVYECHPKDGDCIAPLQEWLGAVCRD